MWRDGGARASRAAALRLLADFPHLLPKRAPSAPFRDNGRARKIGKCQRDQD